MKNLAQALLKVMGEISHLQTDKQVGTGGSSYKGLSDQKATGTIRKALIKYGIIALQSQVLEETTTENWLEQNEYNGRITQKAKIHVFTRVRSTITLIHAESGESTQIQAVGHGIDSGDKAAGKAMTYAKKNALLNSLLISTGLDADDIHSDDLPAKEVPVKSNAGTDKWKSILPLLTTGTDKQKQTLAKMLSSSRCNEIIADATGDWANGKVDVIKAVGLFLKLTVGQPANRYALAVAMSFCKDDAIVSGSIKSINEGKKSGKDALTYFTNLKDK